MLIEAIDKLGAEQKAEADRAYRASVNASVAKISERVRVLANTAYYNHIAATKARGYAVEQANKRHWDAELDAVAVVIAHWIVSYDDILCLELGDPFAINPIPLADVVETILAKVGADIDHHFDKYGPQRLDVANWLMVVVEEEGEADVAFGEGDWEQAKKEIMQVIACWMRFFAETEREASGVAELERAWYTRAQ